MKCTSVVANAGNVEDFGKVIVEVLKKRITIGSVPMKGHSLFILKSEKEE